jgi:sugar/nucleoside kinase (ribokinase family)
MIKKGLFIGLTTLDIQYFVNENPPYNTKIKTDTPVCAAGGPAANAAIAFARLGGQPDFLTCMGKNHFRNFLVNDFTDNGVTLIDLLQNENYNPIISTVVTNVSNSHRTIFTHHPEALSLSHSVDIELDRYAFVFTDGFYPEVAVPFCNEARKKGITVIFDGGSWKPQLPEILPLVDIAICSYNYHPPGCDSLESIFDFTLGQGVKHVAITRGEENIVFPGGEIKIEKVGAIDSLGAGDVLHGAFCWYMQQNIPFEKALKKASEVATFSTLYKGTRKWLDYFQASNPQN